MIVYSNIQSPRLSYILDLLSRFYDHPFEITNDKDLYLSSDKGRINYSEERLTTEELHILPHGLLKEKGITSQSISVSPVGGLPALFPNKSDTGFDIFSAIFYLISRYEEYLPHEKDNYGRFAHQHSLAFKQGFLNRPLVNEWLHALIGKIKTFTGTRLNMPAFRFVPTYDIDIAWSYKRKGLIRNTGGFLRSLFKRDWKSLKERASVLTGKKEDPFDSYGWMESLHGTHPFTPIFFIHAARQTSAYDKNIPASDGDMQALIKRLSLAGEIGLHPSWKSGDEPRLMHYEKQTLEQITGKPVRSSRQHYIRLTLPHTYRTLIDHGIDDDYSMGYGSINGFRASIGSPFYWYDLDKEQTTSLMIHPFCFMDANSFYEQRNTPAEAARELQDLLHLMLHNGGEMITIWHNNFLGTAKQFDGWKEVYADFLSTIR